MHIIDEQGRSHEFPAGITIGEILRAPEMGAPGLIVAARLDHVPVSLSTRIHADARIHPITTNTVEGRRIYERSLVLVLFRAFADLFPEGRLRSLHSISKGIYHSTEIGRPLTGEDVERLRRRMGELIAADIPFEDLELPREEALAHFRGLGLSDRSTLLETFPLPMVPMTRLDGMLQIRFLPTVPTTAPLGVFDLVWHAPGLILRFPRTTAPGSLPHYADQQGLFSIFRENRSWADILEVQNCGELNKAILAGRDSELIKLAEGLHEKKIALIADLINNTITRTKFILIAGPSSSGKTTFAKRLAIQLRVNGIRTTPISTDDYFKSREETPRDEEGNYNFEDLEALDLDLFNRHLQAILQGETVEIPNFSFELGHRKDQGKDILVPPGQPVIIEGIHCLNPELTRAIPRENKFLIYVSALTPLNIDDVNRIPTTDNRILRRIVRDSLFRGYSAYETLNRWPSVRKGEDRNIYPFQDQADVMFNSALLYELPVLRNLALAQLKRVPPTVPEFGEAKRLIAYLAAFLEIKQHEIPPTSILREFIGESSFNY